MEDPAEFEATAGLCPPPRSPERSEKIPELGVPKRPPSELNSEPVEKFTDGSPPLTK